MCSATRCRAPVNSGSLARTRASTLSRAPNSATGPVPTTDPSTTAVREVVTWSVSGSIIAHLHPAFMCLR
jgi:hypothetical protein